MKKTLLFSAAAAMLLSACGGQKSTATPEPYDDATVGTWLLERLDTLRHHGIMFGHQDDPMYGLTWAYDADSSDVLNTCGDWPAVMGFELGGIEMGDTLSLDSVPFARITAEARNHHRRGGVVTMSWHPRNPVTTVADDYRTKQTFPEGSAWDVSDSAVVAAVLPGGARHQLFQEWMQRLSDFLATLTDDNGQPLPVIFRPWHENSGSWFWWGQDLCTADEYRTLWNMLQDKLLADGLTNLVWAYSPGMEDGLTAERLAERYPGDDRVQMIGLDGYQWTPDEKDAYLARSRQNLQVLCQFADDHGLVPALTECGMKNLTEPTWWTSTLLPAVKGFPISYLLVWRNYRKEWFGPSPSQPDAPYFREFHSAPETLFLKDIVI